MSFYVDSDPGADDVVFTAYAFDQYTPIEGSTITYSGTTLNTGNHLNTNTGKFVCPQTGNYVFYSALTSQERNYATTDILVAGNGLATLVPDDFPSVQTGNMAFSFCEEGWEVELQVKFDSRHGIVGSDESRTSTFTGFLVGITTVTINLLLFTFFHFYSLLHPSTHVCTCICVF